MEKLEGKFTQEDIDRVADFVGETTRIISENGTEFEPSRASFLIEGLRHYVKNNNFAESNMRLLIEKYKEVTGREYQQPTLS